MHLPLPWVKGPVLIGTGLCDTIARPETQLTMFNNLTAPKQLVCMPAGEPIDPHTASKAAVQRAWWEAAAAGEPLPMK